MNWRWVGAVGAATALGVAIAAQTGVFSTRIGPDSEVRAPRKELEPEQTAVVEVKEVLRTFSAVGSVATRERSRIAPRLRGTIEEVFVEAGDRVERGDLLVRIRAETTRAKVGQAEQALAGAEAERARAEKDYQRFDALRRDGAATERRFEQVKAARARARAAEARARAALAEARSVRDRTAIRAPSDGQVAQRLVDPGDAAIPGQPVIVLQTPGSLELSVFVREGLATRVAPGTRLRAEVPAVGFEGEAEVVEVVPSVDPASRAFEVRLGSLEGDGLMPGMFGRASIPEGRDRAVLVPETAVRRIGQLELVRVQPEGGDWQLRHVTTGRRFGDRVEVLSGLDGGEHVAIVPSPEGEGR